MLKERKRRFGLLDLRKDPEDIRDKKFLTSLKAHKTLANLRSSLPKQIDHSSLMSPVKDQGYLGSCVGFCVSALKEWQEQKEHKEEVEAGKQDHRDEKYYDLSEAWIYWMCKKIDEWPGEEGTSIRYAMKVLQKIGVPCEKAWPYDDMIYGEPTAWSHLVARWSLIDSYYRVETLDELKAALANGPVVIGIGVFEEIFYPPDNGLITMPADEEYYYGGHAVCAVGYNDDSQLIKFKNSWGTEWGEAGYGYISYDYIRDYMWDAWCARDLSVTKDMLKGAKSLIE
tara:strand:- start:10191 stop:11042 length:852 start_codon:yes stop_codon:yes gene_type:complete